MWDYLSFRDRLHFIQPCLVFFVALLQSMRCTLVAFLANKNGVFYHSILRDENLWVSADTWRLKDCLFFAVHSNHISRWATLHRLFQLTKVMWMGSCQGGVLKLPRNFHQIFCPFTKFTVSHSVVDILTCGYKCKRVFKVLAQIALKLQKSSQKMSKIYKN